MNNIYRSIWNDAAGTFVAVSEHAKGAGKPSSGATGLAMTALTMTALALSLMMIGTGAHAAPTGGVVMAGTATIGGTPGSMVITQTTPNAAINWQNFNVAAGESVRFVQPGSNAVALNRVLGSDPSSILGTLSANGKVFLINPNGILFGKGATVNVGGLVASSLALGDADFMAGRYNFAGTGTGAVTNLGTINAPGGYVALLGAQVGNDGIIAARLGSVALAAGSAITLDVAGDGLLNVGISQGAVDALVRNGGLIQADGGQVLLSARAAGGLLQGAVNNSGAIEARSLEQRNGTIRLTGDAATGTVQVGGTLDASGLAAGETGGTVQVLGNSVNLAGAIVDASGDAGGGLVHIGGGFHGDTAIAQAHDTVVDGGAVHADAIGSGNGGRIAVWSAGDTAVNATLTARGGARGGDGGFIETSGKNVVLGSGTHVNTLAPHGRTGAWLLDPVNWTIAAAGGDETPDDVTASLASSDRLITATNDITVADAVVWTTGQKLQLDAGHDVRINAAMTASTAGSAMVLIAGNDVLVNAALTASAMGSRIELTGGRDVTSTAAVTASAANAKIAMSAGRNLSVAAVTADGGGSADLVARGDVVANGQISADNGVVTLIADNDGTGPGIAGGTVRFIEPASVSAMATTIRFNPATYTGTTTEIAAYTDKVASGTIDARAWVFGQADNKVYDGNNAATLSLRGDPHTGNSVALVAGNATFDNKNVGTAKPVAFTGYTLGGADAAKFALFAPFGTTAGSGTTAADITPRPLMVTATGTNKTYDGNRNDVVALADNRVAGDLLDLTATAANFVDPNVGDGKAVSVTGIGISGADAANYTANATAATTANITPAPLTVRANDATKTYGQTLVLSPSAFTQTGLVNGETIGSVNPASAGTVASASVAGSPYAIVPGAADGGTFTPSNYAITYLNGTLVIQQAPLTVTADSVTRAYDESVALTGFTTSGLANGETVGSVTQTSPGTVASSATPGTYMITPSDATGGTFTPGNYAITYTRGTLTVQAAAVAPPVAPPPVAPPVVVPPVVEPPVIVPPVVVPPAVVPPVTPPAPVTPPPSTPALPPAPPAPTAPATPPTPSSGAAQPYPPVQTPISNVPVATRDTAAPVIVLAPSEVGLQTLSLPPRFDEPRPDVPAAPVPVQVPTASTDVPVPVQVPTASTDVPVPVQVPTASPDAPAGKPPSEPATTVPAHRIRKQDRN
ncbi:filamentous hemagglutinin N-terminal domain-containing protein [Pseudoduganella plicata]|uniref:Filamentous hemagglutinin N-terminal domain-containing protein n=1 Tax=Pseudoduganella plicata TaxID=321984 RepID=A0A4P7BJG4_9BURK|nr:filamentous hemagglutinin N-terminal domain-containing protein [Pseudoduganella plicata]QBQ39054.1 filamentous hemagglutinin N-terminal domain-containing protein [Pseudoduganella plicata]GGY86829.1 hypothetical protein GCM10007388_20160 [Pseudoduganella plicata]